MTKQQAPYQTRLPLDDLDQVPAPDQRQLLRDKLRRTLAAGDIAGASLLIQLAMLQSLERIEDRLAEMADKLNQRDV